MAKTPSTKPAIHVILTRAVLETQCQEVFWGIEEEGIPFDVIRSDDIPNLKVSSAKKGVIELAYAAAFESPLSVGVASDGQQIVVHYRNLPSDLPLFTSEFNHSSCMRNLGNNAARLVKGLPFKALNK